DEVHGGVREVLPRREGRDEPGEERARGHAVDLPAVRGGQPPPDADDVKDEDEPEHPREPRFRDAAKMFQAQSADHAAPLGRTRRRGPAESAARRPSGGALAGAKKKATAREIRRARGEGPSRASRGPCARRTTCRRTRTATGAPSAAPEPR